MPRKAAAGEHYDIEQVRHAAAGLWPDIISALGGLDRNDLNPRRHGPCPKCGGTDRFRAMNDFSTTGGLICNQCHREKNGDGFASLMWLNGVTFPESVKLIARFVGIKPKSGKAPSEQTSADPAERLEFKPWAENIVWLWTLEKPPATVEAVQAIGGKLATFRRGKHHVIAFPVIDQNKKTSGWAIYQTNGKPLPTGWDKEEQRFAKEEKMLLTFGSQPGLIGEVSALTARPNATVILLEGTPDLLALWSIMPTDRRSDYILLTNSNGSNQRPLDWIIKSLSGRRVIIIRDADKEGEAGQARWAAGLIDSASEVRTPKLPYAIVESHGQDLRDWINDGHGWNDFLSLVESTTPLEASEALAAAVKTDNDHVTNFEEIYEEIEGETQKKTSPLAMADVLAIIRQLTDNWPRRVGNALFVYDEKHGISWLSSYADLFGYLHTRTGKVAWKKGVGMVKESEVFSELRRTSETYLSVEDMPHEPMVPYHFYTCGEIVPGDGKALDGLLDRFNPSTEIDRDLLLAAIVTPAWGGPAGSRPAFVITSDDGRGVGKSTAAKIISQVWGGELSFSSQDDIGGMRTRLLSPDGLCRRVAVLDNVKSLRFSWGDWEGLLTAALIGGHKMYVGEATRPNLLTWLITLNGASLSTDVAQRCVIIKLKRPKASGDWEEETLQYIEENRQQIIADCIGFFGRKLLYLTKYTRWGSWEKSILQRLPKPSESQSLIIERQGIADAEADEADLLTEFIWGKLDGLNYDPDKSQIFIPSATAAEWFNLATNERQKTVSACRLISQFIDEGRISTIQKNKHNGWGRGFIWVGKNSDVNDSISTDLPDRLDYQKRGIIGTGGRF